MGRIFSALIFSFIPTKILAVVPRIDMPACLQNESELSSAVQYNAFSLYSSLFSCSCFFSGKNN